MCGYATGHRISAVSAPLPVAAAAVVLASLITPIVAFVVLAAVDNTWGYAKFVLPLVALAVGMSLQNGPASSISTACVPPDEVGAASGISNMARYVGAAVMTTGTAHTLPATSATP